MAPIEVIIGLLEAGGLVIAIIATSRIIREKESLGRSAAQLAFVWLVPFIGPLVTIRLLRKERESRSGSQSSNGEGWHD